MTERIKFDHTEYTRERVKTAVKNHINRRHAEDIDRFKDMKLLKTEPEDRHDLISVEAEIDIENGYRAVYDIPEICQNIGITDIGGTTKLVFDVVCSPEQLGLKG